MPNYVIGDCSLCGVFSAYLLPQPLRNRWTGSLYLMNICENCRNHIDYMNWMLEVNHDEQGKG